MEERERPNKAFTSPGCDRRSQAHMRSGKTFPVHFRSCTCTCYDDF